MIVTLLREPEALDVILSPVEVEMIRDALAVIHPDTGRAVALAGRLEAEFTGALDVMAARAKRAGAIDPETQASIDYYRTLDPDGSRGRSGGRS